MLPELIVLEGLLYWLDGLVVDVQQRLHGTWRGVKERQTGLLGWLWKRALRMLLLPLLTTPIAPAVCDESAS